MAMCKRLFKTPIADIATSQTKKLRVEVKDNCVMYCYRVLSVDHLQKVPFIFVFQFNCEFFDVLKILTFKNIELLYFNYSYEACQN